MESFWFGMGLVALFFTALVLLPFVIMMFKKDQVAPPANVPASPPVGQSRTDWGKFGKKVLVFGLAIIAILLITSWWKILVQFFLPEGQLSQLLATGDWVTTTPGKAIDASLGAGWANWVLWLTVALFVFWLAMTFIPTKNKKSDNSGGFVIALVLIGLTMAITTAFVKGGDETILDVKPVYVPFDLRNAEVGGEGVVAQMTITDIALVKMRLPPPNTGEVLWGCARVIKPKLPVPVEFEAVSAAPSLQGHLALTSASKQALLEYGIMSLVVELTLKQGSPDINPCPKSEIPNEVSLKSESISSDFAL